MRVYWYWPFAKPEELPLADEVAARGVELTVDTLPRRRPPEPAPGFTHRPQVAEVSPRHRPPSPAWLASRALTYARRARERNGTVHRLRPAVVHAFFVNRFTDGWWGFGQDPSGRSSTSTT